MSMTHKQACEAAARENDLTEALKAVMNFCGIDDGAFAHEFITGLDRMGDADWKDIDHSGRAFELEHASACEVETMVVHAIGGDDDREAMDAAKAADYRFPVALASFPPERRTQGERERYAAKQQEAQEKAAPLLYAALKRVASASATFKFEGPVMVSLSRDDVRAINEAIIAAETV